MLHIDWISSITQLSRPLTLEAISQRLLSEFWPGHKVIHIVSFQTYVDIEKILDTIPAQIPKIILQIEEDWFIKTHFETVRNSIKNHKNWTDECFIITNSHLDAELTTAMGVKCIFKPAILDLVCYWPYDTSTIDINVNSIKWHTGYLYNDMHAERTCAYDVLENYFDRLSVLKKNDTVVNNTDFPNDQLFGNEERTCTATQDITTDAWIENSAFLIAMEGLTHTEFSPTLSEKVFRSMHWLRPCLVFGGHRSKNYLNDLGFDTWDWLIDWNFDQEPDRYTRLQKFEVELNRLMSINMDDLKILIHDNQDSLYHNRNRIEWLLRNFNQI